MLTYADLRSVHTDPTGRLLAARERSAADKRQYALELLEQKEAAVARRRRELQVQDARMLTYADVCWRMLTDADVC